MDAHGNPSRDESAGPFDSAATLRDVLGLGIREKTKAVRKPRVSPGAASAINGGPFVSPAR